MKIAFVIRDIPDLDHLTPIIYKFLTLKKEIVILNYEINLNLQNDFRIKFLKKCDSKLSIINVYSFINQNIIYSFLSSIFDKKNYQINFKNIKNYSKIENNYIKFFFISFIKKIFFKKDSKFENFFFNKKWLSKVINELNIKILVLDDSFYFTYKKGQLISDVCEDKNIKVYLIPHTLVIFNSEEDYEALKKINLKKLYPKIIVNSDYKKKKLIKYGINQNKINVLGNGRFSPEWFEIFKILTGCIEKKKNSVTKVLFFEGVYNNKILEKKLIKYLYEKDNIKLTIKGHPRGIFSSNNTVKKITNNFEIDLNTPSTKLIFDSDIIIGTFSSIIVDAFILNKVVINPRFLLNLNEIELLYEGKNFSFDCNSNEEVLDIIQKYKNNKLMLNKENLQVFMSNFVYGNNNKEKILEEYVEIINCT